MVDYNRGDDSNGFAAARLEILEDQWAVHKNPITLWEIYHLCRKRGLAIPPLVFDYLDGVAQVLVNPPDFIKAEGGLDKRQKTKNTERVQRHAAKALKLRVTEYNQLPQIDAVQELFTRLPSKYVREPDRFKKAQKKSRLYKEIAEKYGVSKSYLQKVYKESDGLLDRLYPEGPPDDDHDELIALTLDGHPLLKK